MSNRFSKLTIQNKIRTVKENINFFRSELQNLHEYAFDICLRRLTDSLEDLNRLNCMLRELEASSNWIKEGF